MFFESDRQIAKFWHERDFWKHLLILFGIFVYLYSPLLDYALGHPTHSRPHNHIPVKLVHQHEHGLFHDASHTDSEAADEHICALDFPGLILLGLFITFIAGTRQPIQNLFVYKVETNWTKLVLNRQPPPNPPPRFSSLSV